MTEQACDKYREEGLVCPPSLKRQMFTTAAIDNVDITQRLILQKVIFMAHAFPYSNIRTFILHPNT